jgi:hypothetical protein
MIKEMSMVNDPHFTFYKFFKIPNDMKRRVMFFSSIIMFVLIPVLHSQPEKLTLENGDQLSWDGAYYDFRDSEGIKMIKLWIPPGTHPLKGIFISGHGGGSGDSRNFARDENIRGFAMRLGFGVAGLHNFPGRRAYSEGAEVFFETLTHFAEMGYHPELDNIPFVMYGSSNGGATTYGFVNYAPERAICFLANVSAGYNPEEPVPEALKVPGIFIIGKFDALIGQRGIDRTRQLVENARKNEGRWAWALELKGHEDGASFDTYMKLVEQAVGLRYPADADPINQKVGLKEVKEKEGWLVDMDSWDSGLTYIDEFEEYSKDIRQAGWVLNKDMAYVYRGLATHHNPLSIIIREFDPTFNPNTDPGTMFSLGGPVVDPGQEITIYCDTEDFPEWEKLDFYNGSQKLGEVYKGSDPEIKIKLDPDEKVYCLTVLGENKTGEKRTSDPMHFFIRDPELYWKANLPVPKYKDKLSFGSRKDEKFITAAEVDPEDSVLIAYGLNSEMEKSFSGSDNQLSGFWELIDEDHDLIHLTQRKNAADGADFNFVLTHDCNMTVKAAYGGKGIYLLFIINDDNDVAWPNQFTGTEKEQFYLNFDAVDVLIDSRSVEEIVADVEKKTFLSKSFGLTFTTKQYQVACGKEKQRPEGFQRSVPDPWDFHNQYFSFNDAKEQLGMQIENIKLSPFYKAQEWFIPWSEYGGGLQKEPEAGEKIAFTAGFNDRDEGEHFPPGVNSSGGTVKASNALRWIGKTDPWGSNKPPYAWGEIMIGPMLE